MKQTAFLFAVLAATVASAEQVVDISGVGNKKFTVQVNVAHPAYARCLKRNLELSGLFAVGGSGAIKVTGGPHGGAQAGGRDVPGLRQPEGLRV